MKEKILITGVTGFVGSHLADYIIKKKFNVELFGLKSNENAFLSEKRIYC